MPKNEFLKPRIIDVQKISDTQAKVVMSLLSAVMDTHWVTHCVVSCCLPCPVPHRPK